MGPSVPRHPTVPTRRAARMQMEVGQHKSNTFRVHATKPRLFGTRSTLSAELSKSVASHQVSRFVLRRVELGLEPSEG